MNLFKKIISCGIVLAFIIFIFGVSSVKGNNDLESGNFLPFEILNDLFTKAAAELKHELRLSSTNKLKRQAQPNATKLNSHFIPEKSVHGMIAHITPKSKVIHESFLVALRASKKISENVTLSNQTSSRGIKLKAPPKFCPFSFDSDCDSTNKYRTIDGSCNNLNSSQIGKSSTPFKRFMKSAYDDGINEPRRMSADGSRQLPNPRSIALAIHSPLDIMTRLNHMGVMFGQYVDHDFALSAASTSEKCNCDSNSANCINIVTPDDDFLNSDQTCMALTRSGASFQKFDCNLGAREQLNLQTHFLDMSQLYGSDTSEMNNVRTFSNGLLKSTRVGGFRREFLPQARPGLCAEETDEHLCFDSGDKRTSQNMLLVSVHTIWLREHNRIARALRRMHPDWDDESLFQEARRIAIAEYQNIIYSEWLPLFVGQRNINENNLAMQQNQYFMGYDENTNPHLAAEFSTAAFRFGHTLIRSFITKSDSSLKGFDNITLTSVMLRPTEAYVNGGIDSLIRGLLVDSGTSFDNHITDEIENHLFETSAGDTHRFSLPAINIMRGRDHGIPPYNEFRVFSGLKKAKLFKDMQEIPFDVRRNLRAIYGNVDDIDAFSGGISEMPIDGALLGPTFANIVAKQFRDLKLGDRFYFENGHDSVSKFTPSQLDEIRKSSMAAIMCSNLFLSVVQKQAFLPIGDDNPLVDCQSIPRIRLNEWKNEQLPQKNQNQNQDQFNFQFNK